MIKMNPAQVVLIPVGGNDQIVSGIQFTIDPNGNNMAVGLGRVRINSLYMDLLDVIDTNFTTAPMGMSLMALTENLNLVFINDNFGDKLVISVVDRKSDTILVTPVLYKESAIGATVPSNSIVDIFNSEVGVDAQIRMLFNEIAVNKTKDAELKYQEILEALPTASYNAFVKETFVNATNFISNTLVYNAYTRSVALGIMAPFPDDLRVLREKVVLPNVVDKAYVAVDMLLNGQTCNVRFSFDNGVTWIAYVADNEHIIATPGKDFVIEFAVRTNNRNVTPVLRSWAVFYKEL